MSELSQRLANLNPEQRALLEARLLLKQKKTPDSPSTLSKRNTSEPALLSFSQERLWFLEQLEGVSANYNICSALRFKGELRIDYLENAISGLTSRHESLRTTFDALPPQERPVQRISASSAFHLKVVDVSAKADSEKENALRLVANEIAWQPMPLSQGPLFRAVLVRVAPRDHVLVVVMHHIISDGWSINIFFRELSALYADFCSGRSPILPHLEIQYADFAQWQRERLQGAELDRNLNYWKEQLRGLPPLLELPADFPRPSEQGYKGQYCERRISAALSERINHLCRESESTLFMVLLTALQALLHRYSGQTDISVGSPVTNRTHVELEPLIGFFLNTLVFRTDFSGDPTVRQLIQSIRQTTMEALSHQDLPFEKLVRELRPERSLSYSPFFQVALMLQQDDQRFVSFPGLTIEPYSVNTCTAKFDLTLFASETENGLWLWLEYATDLFTADTANQLLAHLECVLESITANPELPVSRLNLLPETDREKILVEWNKTSAPYPADKTVHELIENQAARTPNAIAVEYGRQKLTYGELNDRADVLAEVLRQKGVTVETPVGVYVERSIDMVVGVLGVMKAGGYYVPLDPAFPVNRLTYMIADAQIPLFVTQSKLMNELPGTRAQAVCIDNEVRRQSTVSVPTQPTSRRSNPENLIYTLYTSGSTGNPKGVQISHRCVVNFIDSMRHAPGLTADDVLLAVTTLSFDIAGLELFLPLTSGARVVIASREETLDPAALAKLIEHSRATVMQATPATWRMLLEAGWRGDSKLKVLCGGEALDRSLADRLLTCVGELWNMYGPTETTIWSTTERLMPGEPITIGRPIANTQVYVLDKNFQPTPPGVIGELFIGGDGVGRGYLNQANLTREKFVADPFCPSGLGRLYRTGDLARFRSDGRLDFLGREDHQVKIRGFRIETGEIETALSAIAGVAQAVVIVRDDAGGKRLVAYVVPKTASSAMSIAPDNAEGPLPIGAAFLRTALRLKLPDYMIPASFVFLDALPLTPNGKVDRKALPAPDQAAISQIQYESPRGPTEEILAGIMASLLQVPRVGRKDDFFDLGGHSILAVTFFNAIEREFGKRIPLATLFRSPTIQNLALVLDADRELVHKWHSLVPIQTGGTKPRFFCVHGAGGNILLYRTLVQCLGSDYPFYGLQSQGLDRNTAPLRSVEEMANRYIQEMRALQPEGPYCLGGYCMGGTIAYEMAQQLSNRGYDVALLALFDTYNFTRMRVPGRFGYIRQKIAFHMGNLSVLSWKNLSEYLSAKIQVARHGEFRSLWNAITSRRNRGQSLEANINDINDAAAEAYNPKPYSGKVTVFKPRVNYDFFPDPKMGWSDIVQDGLNVIELPVNPHAMLEAPFVETLADHLRKHLDGVAASRTG